MGIRAWLAKKLVGDLRGTNPASIANLKQFQTREAAAVRTADEPSGFFKHMLEYEQLRQQILRTEYERTQQIQQQLMDSLGDEEPADNSDALLGTLLSSVLAGRPAAPPPAAPAAVEPEMSDEQIAAIVEDIAGRYPKVLKDVRSGKIPEAQAIAYLQSMNVGATNAKRIYDHART